MKPLLSLNIICYLVNETLKKGVPGIPLFAAIIPTIVFPTIPTTMIAAIGCLNISEKIFFI